MGSARKLTTWNGSGAYFQCSPRQVSLITPNNLSRLILLETVLIQLITQPRQASWEHNHGWVSYPGRWHRSPVCIPLRHHVLDLHTMITKVHKSIIRNHVLTASTFEYKKYQLNIHVNLQYLRSEIQCQGDTSRNISLLVFIHVSSKLTGRVNPPSTKVSEECDCSDDDKWL